MGASIYDVRKIFRFFDPLPPCPQIRATSLTKVCLLCLLLKVPPLSAESADVINGNPLCSVLWNYFKVKCFPSVNTTQKKISINKLITERPFGNLAAEHHHARARTPHHTYSSDPKLSDNV